MRYHSSEEGVVHAQHARGAMQVSINHKNKSKMKKYIFNVFAAGVLATQAMGMGYNQDEALMDACLNLSVSDYPEDEISDVVLDHVEF